MEEIKPSTKKRRTSSSINTTEKSLKRQRKSLHVDEKKEVSNRRNSKIEAQSTPQSSHSYSKVGLRTPKKNSHNSTQSKNNYEFIKKSSEVHEKYQECVDEFEDLINFPDLDPSPNNSKPASVKKTSNAIQTRGAFSAKFSSEPIQLATPQLAQESLQPSDQNGRSSASESSGTTNQQTTFSTRRTAPKSSRSKSNWQVKMLLLLASISLLALGAWLSLHRTTVIDFPSEYLFEIMQTPQRLSLSSEWWRSDRSHSVPFWSSTNTHPQKIELSQMDQSPNSSVQIDMSQMPAVVIEISGFLNQSSKALLQLKEDQWSIETMVEELASDLDQSESMPSNESGEKGDSPVNSAKLNLAPIESLDAMESYLRALEHQFPSPSELHQSVILEQQLSQANAQAHRDAQWLTQSTHRLLEEKKQLEAAHQSVSKDLDSLDDIETLDSDQPLEVEAQSLEDLANLMEDLVVSLETTEPGLFPQSEEYASQSPGLEGEIRSKLADQLHSTLRDFDLPRRVIDVLENAEQTVSGPEPSENPPAMAFPKDYLLSPRGGKIISAAKHPLFTSALFRHADLVESGSNASPETHFSRDNALGDSISSMGERLLKEIDNLKASIQGNKLWRQSLGRLSLRGVNSIERELNSYLAPAMDRLACLKGSSGNITISFHSPIDLDQLQFVYLYAVYEDESLRSSLPRNIRLVGWRQDPTKVSQSLHPSLRHDFGEFTLDLPGQEATLAVSSFAHLILQDQQETLSDLRPPVALEESDKVVAHALNLSSQSPLAGTTSSPIKSLTIQVLSNQGHESQTCFHRIKALGRLHFN